VRPEVSKEPRSWYFSTPAYTGLVVTWNGFVTGGMGPILWSKGKTLEFLKNYAERRWPNEVRLEEIRQ
jgi:hypothetical protein